jgi:FixJ family two-component response regulator
MQRPRVVIVDDDENMLSVLHYLVRDAVSSASIEEFSSSGKALIQLRSKGADLVITDCYLPEMSGPELVKHLRRTELNMPIIMISGCSSARWLGQDAGVDHFIEKQFLHTDLVEAVHNFLKPA